MVLVQDAMDEVDYTAQLLAHIMDGNDVINAKFLYQRVPDEIKQQSKPFNQAWTAVKHLANARYGEGLALLRGALPPAGAAAAANPIKNALEVLRQILVWNLSEHIVPELIANAYSTIELRRVKEMLGNGPEVDQILAKTGLLASANADNQGFVEVRPAQASSDTFALG